MEMRLFFNRRMPGTFARRLLGGALAGTSLIFPSTEAPAADIPWVWYSSDAPSGVEELAVLTDTLRFNGDRIEVQHRLRALRVEPDVKVTPTTHVHQNPARPPQLGSAHARAIESALLGTVRNSSSGWVQLDFEAFDSQRNFYASLVKNLRASLPETIKLSVTVRAAWCDRPALLDSLAADEVVPMFFHMGEVSGEYRERLMASPESLAGRCRRQAIGLASQEPVPAEVSARYQRRYWFNYRKWQ